jgi:hypothetical protein
VWQTGWTPRHHRNGRGLVAVVYSFQATTRPNGCDPEHEPRHEGEWSVMASRDDLQRTLDEINARVEELGVRL